MKYLSKPKTSITKKLLGVLLNVLKRKPDTCAREVCKILVDFEKWDTLVDNVWFALSEKSGMQTPDATIAQLTFGSG